LIIIQTNSGNRNQPAVKKLKLLLQVVADVADRFIDSPAGAG
jgi:hypothetical protein